MRIILALDGSEYSEIALDKLIEGVLKPGDKVKIVSSVEPVAHIVGAPFGVVDEYYHRVLADANKEAGRITEKAAAKVAARFPEADVSTETLLGSPANAIVEAAEKSSADLIVVGSHGRGFLERVLLGSVSSGVVHNASCSVLVVRK